MILLLLGACGDAPKPYMDFKDVFKPSLVINAGDAPGRGEGLQVLVHPERAGTCRPLPKLTAEVDGVPLTRLHGKVKGEFEYDRDCYVYEFVADAAALAKRPAKDVNVVKVTDGETTLEAEVQHLFSPRTLRVEGEVKPGAPLVLVWAPGGDTMVEKVQTGVTIRSGERTEIVRELTVTPVDVRFTLPEWAGKDTTAEFIGTAALQPTVSRCGATTCSASRVYTVPPVTLFP